MGVYRLWPALAAFALAGCDSGGSAENVHAAPDAAPTETELAADAALAKEAAADEAADMHNFGGNAAAMDAANGL
ncbi:MAG TPA: hypothetical protein VF552_08110 [Allosphingosinicella sp.]|jgi:hypothetical protein